MAIGPMILGLGGTALLILLVALGIGYRRWNRAVARLDAAVVAASEPAGPIAAHLLPDPVARYLAGAIPENGPPIRVARLRQSGTFLLGAGPDAWKRFSAHEVFRGDTPAFYWDARITVAPLLSVRVRDSYVGGQASMVGRLAGVIAVVDEAGGEALARGALARYLAEAVWFPTRLAVGAGLSWASFDETSARATLEDNGIAVSLTFSFDERGDVVGVSGIRPREVDGEYVETPWVGRFAEHRLVGGFRIPTYGEVAWVIDGVETTYWRGTVTETAFTLHPRS
ncbi:MAG: hypothetical protein P8170_24675 [Gemmatimonadota bacterium]